MGFNHDAPSNCSMPRQAFDLAGDERRTRMLNEVLDFLNKIEPDYGFTADFECARMNVKDLICEQITA